MSIAWIVPGAFRMTPVKAQTCLEPLKISEGLSDRDIFAHMHVDTISLTRFSVWKESYNYIGAKVQRRYRNLQLK